MLRIARQLPKFRPVIAARQMIVRRAHQSIVPHTPRPVLTYLCHTVEALSQGVWLGMGCGIVGAVLKIEYDQRQVKWETDRENKEKKEKEDKEIHEGLLSFVRGQTGKKW